VKIEYNLTIRNPSNHGLMSKEEFEWYIPILARLITYTPIVMLWVLFMVLLSMA